MRKTLVSILALGLIAAALSAAPALAKKKKTVTIHKEFSAGPHAPMPSGLAGETEGCLESTEGVNKTTVDFKTPGKGIITVTIDTFEGDWDLYLLQDGALLASSSSSQLEGAAAEEKIMMNLGAKKAVSIVACNWAGGPTAEGMYMYKYTK